MSTDDGGPTILLTLIRAFLAQFGSFESSGPGADPRRLVAAVLTLLAAPGYYVSLQAVILGPRLIAERRHVPPFAWFWKEEWLIFVMSFCAVAVLAVAESRAFVLDDRDYRILGALPIRRSTVLVAKTLSICAIVLVLHLSVNVLSGLVLPIVGPAAYIRGVMALQVALLAQTVFVVGAIVSSQALVSGLLPGSLVGGGAPLLRGAVFLGVGFLLLSQGWIPALALAVWNQPHPLNDFLPVIWFQGLYRYLLGAEAEQFARQAQLALAVTAGSVVVAVPCCLLGYRDAEGRRRGGTRAPLPSLATEALGVLGSSSATSRGVGYFLVRALARGPGAPLIFQGWKVLGLALLTAGLVRALTNGSLVLGVPTPLTVAPAIVLPFFGLVAIRSAASYPTSLTANWLFRVTGSTEARDYRKGTWSATMATAVVPTVLISTVPTAFAWGIEKAVVLLALSSGIAVVTYEWLFFGFQKIPFTCSYLPGGANLRVTWPRHVAVGLLYCEVLPVSVAWVLPRTIWWGTSLVALAVTWWALYRYSERQPSAAAPLAFEERATPLITELGLNG